MDIRVTLAATGPIPDSLLACIPAPLSKTVDETPYGQRVNIYTRHDDPAALRGYGERFGADPAWWQMVRAPDTAEEQALLRRLGVVVIPDGRGDYEHNAALLVFDTRGKLVRIFDMEERVLALNYARHLAQQSGTSS